MKTTFALGVVLCGSIIAASQTSDRGVQDADTRLQAALKRGDRSAVAALLDDGFTWTNNRLGIRIRRRVLDDLAPTTGSDAGVAVRVYGQLAVVTGTHHSSRQNTDARFVRVWVNKSGAWTLLLHQGTEIPATPPPPAPRPTGSGAEPELSTAGMSDVQREVVAAFQAVERASASHDPDLLATYTADEFVRVDGRTGKTASKTEWAQTLRAAQGQPPVRPGLNTNLQVRVFGDAAVLTVDYQLAPGAARSHSTRVFVKREGRWQQVLHQQTPLPSATVRYALDEPPELRQAIDGLARARQAANALEWERWAAEESVTVRADGSIHTKAQELETIRSFRPGAPGSEVMKSTIEGAVR